MGKKLYVGNLQPEITDAQLSAMFAACGTVTSATVIAEKTTGQSRGFGFVEMSTDAEAQEAIKKMHNTPAGDKQLVVNEARPMPEQPPKGFRGYDGGQGGYGGRGPGGGYGGKGGFGGGRDNRKSRDSRGGGRGR
jgi:RNA recognition motif-containing protein